MTCCRIPCGHVISDEGICPDNEKLKALRHFHTPITIKELRSSLGLVAQFGAFGPDKANLTSHLQWSIQKDTPWLLLLEYTADFEDMMKAFTISTMLQPFDPKVKAVFLADSSWLF